MGYLPFSNYIYSKYYKENREDYYKQFIQEPNLSAICALLETDSKHTIYTLQEIACNAISFGASSKEVTKLWGKSKYTYALDLHAHSYEIKVYKRRLAGCTLISICHFLDDRVIILNNLCPNPSTGLKAFIATHALQKYNLPIEVQKEAVLKDPNGNRLLVSNFLYPSFYYLTGNELIRSSIKSELRLQEHEEADYYSQKHQKVLNSLL